MTNKATTSALSFRPSTWETAESDLRVRLDHDPDNEWPIALVDVDDTTMSMSVAEARGIIVALTEAVAACNQGVA